MAWQPSNYTLYTWLVAIWKRQEQTSASLDRIEQNTAAVQRDIRTLRFWLSPVGPIDIFFERTLDMALKFWFRLPVLPTDYDALQDIASGELTVNIAGGLPIVVMTGKTDGEPLPDGTNAGLKIEDSQFLCVDGDIIDGSFCYIDPANNRSPNPSTVSVRATVPDTIPPVNPGALEVGFEALP